MSTLDRTILLHQHLSHNTHIQSSFSKHHQQEQQRQTSSSTSNAVTMAASAAPWQKLFLEHVQSLGCQTYTLATIRNNKPRARTVIFRGMYGSLTENHHNKAPRNSSGYSSNLPTYSTDIRMQKAHDLGGEAVLGPVEAVFWIPSEENPSKGHQWRLQGHSIVLPNGTPPEETSKFVMERLYYNGNEAEKKPFDIALEETAHFGNLSPNLQASFKNPVPNTPKETGTQEGLGLDVKSKGLDDEIARKNFRVGLIEADRVEWVDLNQPAKRVWVRAGSLAEKDEGLDKFGKQVGEWREVDMWP